MFRFSSRVAVVAIVLVAFAIASVPAYAVPQDGGKAAVKAESGWFESVIAWVHQVIFGDRPPVGSATDDSSYKAIPLNGSCIDPLGRCG